MACKYFLYPPFKLLDQTHRPWGPTLEILQKPLQECLDILLTSFIEGAPYRKEDSTWHNGRWFLFCLFWRMIHKSYTLIVCLEEWLINLLIHAYQCKILLRLFHHFSFHPCCSYWILVYFRFRVVTVFTVFRFLTDFVCLYKYEFGLSLCKIVRCSVILLLPLFAS